MPALLFCLIAVLAYLLGSIPFGYLLVRVFRSQDIRHTGSGNIGATNVVRSGARGLGALTLVLDALKGFLAVALARELMVAWARAPQAASGWMRLDMAAGMAAMAAVLGHVFPVWLGFKGGKGVATALGALLQIVPLAALAGVLVFGITVALSRYVSLASLAASVSIPVVALLTRRDAGGILHRPWLLMAVLGIPAIVIARHHANIARLAAGTEYRFGGRKAP